MAGDVVQLFLAPCVIVSAMCLYKVILCLPAGHSREGDAATPAACDILLAQTPDLLVQGFYVPAIRLRAECACRQAVAGEVLKPFLAACEIKSPKLVSIALVSIQKLLANDLVTAEGMLAVTRALEQVRSLHASPRAGCLRLNDTGASCWIQRISQIRKYFQSGCSQGPQHARWAHTLLHASVRICAI